MVSRLAIFLSLVSYVYFGNIFTARKVFIVTSYFTSLYTSLFHFWPLAITYLAELYVSMQRIQEFLLLPEHKPMLPEDGDVGHETEKLLKNGEAHKPANGLQTNGVNNKEDKALSRRIANRHVTHASILFKNTTADWIIDGKSRQAGKCANIVILILPVCVRTSGCYDYMYFLLLHPHVGTLLAWSTDIANKIQTREME